MKTDIVFLDRIRLSVHVGTIDEERALPQELIVSIRLGASLREAGRSDDLRRSVDYSLIERETRAVESRKFNLVESVAEAVANRCLQHAGVNEVWVRVEKRVFKTMECVGVEIWREKD